MTKPMKTKVKKTVLYGLLFMASKWSIIALLYTSGFWSYWFLLLFPIADTIAATIAIIYLTNNYRRYFKQVLKKAYPKHFKSILIRIELKNDLISIDTKFGSKSKNPMDKRLPFSGYFLAMIKVLEEKGESFEKIRTLSLEVAHAYVKPKNRIHRWVKIALPELIKLPMAGVLLQKMNKKVSIAGHPEGFVAHILTDKKETLGFGYGIDIIECGICKLFRNNQAKKYTSILCEVDKLTSGLAGLQLIRSGTIANGARKCDFRFKKI